MNTKIRQMYHRKDISFDVEQTNPTENAKLKILVKKKIQKY